MRKAMILTVACGVLVAQAAFGANQVRISQVYGGGGSTSMTATYNQDYVEIYNSGATAVNIGGWTIEYGSAGGNWGSTSANIFTFPNPTNLPGCRYILVAQGTPSTGGGPLPVTPDFTGTLTIGATDGKVALFNAVNSNVACGSELAGTLVDKVAFGSGNCPEVTATGVLANNRGAVRNNGGAADTDNNVNDFTVVTNPVPRNSGSPTNPVCTPIAVEPQTWSNVKALYNQ